LTPAELLDLLLLVHSLGVERHADADAGVVLHTAALLLVVLLLAARIAPALDYEPAVAGGDQALEDGGELLGDLLESALDRLVLDPIEVRDQLLNRLLRRVEFLAPLQQLLLLRGEVVVLLESLLVDVLELLQSFVDRLEPFGYLSARVSSPCADDASRPRLTLPVSIRSYLSNASSGRTPRSRMLLAHSPSCC